MKDFIAGLDKKKAMYLVGGLVAIILVFLIFNIIGTQLFSKKSYEEIESIMKNAAIKYYGDNERSLPNTIGNSKEVDDSTLSDGKYMKPMEKLLNDKNKSCTGKVRVTNVNNNYKYTSILDCGDDYQTVSFIDYLKKNSQVVENGEGLYSMNDQLVYRGENVSNYVVLNDKTFRIVKIEENEAVLIFVDRLINTDWDNRYNTERKSKVGINDYSVSRINDYLQDLYDGEDFLTNENKLLLVSYGVPIGKRDVNSEDKSGELEKADVYENQYIGLLPLYDFLNASLDENCVISTSTACVNYNYLVKFDISYWTSTADSNTTHKVYKVDIGAGGALTNASTNAAVQPVIHISNDAIYVSGDGSKDNPYKIK